MFLPFEAMNEAMTTIAEKNPKWNPDLPVIMRRNAAFAVSWRDPYPRGHGCSSLLKR